MALSTFDAEYVALTQLEADALITLDRQLADAVKDPGDCRTYRGAVLIEANLANGPAARWHSSAAKSVAGHTRRLTVGSGWCWPTVHRCQERNDRGCNLGRATAGKVMANLAQKLNAGIWPHTPAGPAPPRAAFPATGQQPAASPQPNPAGRVTARHHARPRRWA